MTPRNSHGLSTTSRTHSGRHRSQEGQQEGHGARTRSKRLGLRLGEQGAGVGQVGQLEGDLGEWPHVLGLAALR